MLIGTPALVIMENACAVSVWLICERRQLPAGHPGSAVYLLAYVIIKLLKVQIFFLQNEFP